MKRLLPLLFIVVSPLLAQQPIQQAQAPQAPQVPHVTQPALNPQIDYNAFLALTRQLQPQRFNHRVTVERFLQMASEPNTIILDTRSKAAFEELHIKGALHLNFSDFTEEKLKKVIPGKDTRILIYCNNNFESELPAVALKSPPLALNIPTYINLVGYGYQNVYELASVETITKTQLPFEGTLIEPSNYVLRR